MQSVSPQLCGRSKILCDIFNAEYLNIIVEDFDHASDLPNQLSGLNLIFRRVDLTR